MLFQRNIPMGRGCIIYVIYHLSIIFDHKNVIHPCRYICTMDHGWYGSIVQYVLFVTSCDALRWVCLLWVLTPRTSEEKTWKTVHCLYSLQRLWSGLKQWWTFNYDGDHRHHHHHHHHHHRHRHLHHHCGDRVFLSNLYNQFHTSRSVFVCVWVSKPSEKGLSPTEILILWLCLLAFLISLLMGGAGCQQRGSVITAHVSK